ncbi:ABC transporter permease [bacterium]|nr:ABC transporter permease [bacterium]
MFKNYFRTAIRSLLKHKVYSLINILGLAVGIASCVLIAGYIRYELSYDQQHEKADRIYRIVWESNIPQTRTPHPMSYQMVKDLPQVEAAVSISPIWGPGLTKPSFSVRFEEKLFEEKAFLSVDTTFFRVFSFPFVSGNPITALQNPASVIITERMAKKYFGKEPALGKILTINGDTELMISGVIEDVPEASHFHFDFLVPYTFFKARETSDYYKWADFGHYNYIVLRPDTDTKALAASLPAWAGIYRIWSEVEKQAFASGALGFGLQPLADIHLHSHLRWELNANGHISYIYILSAAALFILLIACVNFMNLTTARSMERAKEIGMRKTLGATKGQLIGQFYGEALLYSFLGVFGAAFLVDLLGPVFGELAGKTIEWSFLELIPWLLALMVLVAFLAGTYPALVLSSFEPQRALRGRFINSSQGNQFRRGLVIFQFAISTTLIAGTLIAFQQLRHMRNADIGFDQFQTLVVPIHGNEMAERYKTVKESWAQHTGVVGISAISNVPGGNFNQNPVAWRINEDQVDMSEVSVDEDFFDVMGLEMLEGRPLSDTYGTDSAFSYVMNETAARQFDWDTPIGKELIWMDDIGDFRGKVVGVVKDFNFKSLHQPIGPLIFRILPAQFNHFLIKINTREVDATLAQLESSWGNFETERAFTYSFLDEDFADLYVAEERMSILLGIFTLLAIFIACLGLFGLAFFTAEKRSREIGIRKIMGASPRQIVMLLTGDQIKLVLVSFVLVTPFAWWGMNKWLEEFAFRIDLSLWIFFVAGAIAFSVALFTVGIMAFRAANANPAEVLRAE